MSRALRILIAGALASMSAVASQSALAQSCDRACLTDIMNAYVDALVRHDRTTVPTAANARETVNGRESRAESDYLWQLADGVPYRQISGDPTTGQVTLLGVVTEAGARGPYWLRLKVQNHKIAEIEQIVGARTAGGVPGLAAPNPYFEEVLPKESRSSREQLVAIADSYFEGLEKHSGAGVQTDPHCRRFENGNQTSLNPLGNNWPCNEMDDYVYMDRIKERRFPVVDVERGVVVGAMVIEVSKPKAPAVPIAHPGTGPNPQSIPLFSRPHDTLIQEVFKISKGKIQEINVIRQDMPYRWGSGW